MSLGVLRLLHTPLGGGTASLRVGTQNKTTDLWFFATIALSHYPCRFMAPCFWGIKGQAIVIIVVTAVYLYLGIGFQLIWYNYFLNYNQNTNYG